MKTTIQLTRGKLEKYDENWRDSYHDRRKKVARAIFSYYSEDGIEYRKVFCAEPFTPENMFWNLAPEVLNIYPK